MVRSGAVISPRDIRSVRRKSQSFASCLSGHRRGSRALRRGRGPGEGARLPRSQTMSPRPSRPFATLLLARLADEAGLGQELPHSAPSPLTEEAAAAPGAPRNRKPRRPRPSPSPSPHYRLRSAARARAGSGSTGCGQDSATAPCRSTPPTPGCTTSRARRTRARCPRRASRRSPPGCDQLHPLGTAGPSPNDMRRTGDLLDGIDVRRLDPIVVTPTEGAGVNSMRRLRSGAGRRGGRLSGGQDGLGKRQAASFKLFTIVVRFVGRLI